MEWSERLIPFARRDEGWVTVIGIDLDAGSGSYPAEVSFSYADGRVRCCAVRWMEKPMGPNGGLAPLSETCGIENLLKTESSSLT